MQGQTADIEQQADQEAPDAPSPNIKSGNRIASMDFIRGIAVMGILGANIVVFGQPMSAMAYPGGFLVPHSALDDWLWVAQFVLVDGKMRALFSMLFGAGVVLFMDRARAKGATNWLQVKRLLWLGVFGLIHYFFIWRGDILFGYACAGLITLLFIDLSRRNQLVLGIIGYVLGALMFLGLMASMQFVADTPMGDRPVFAEMAQELELGQAGEIADGHLEAEMISRGRYGDWVAHNFASHATDLSGNLFYMLFETVPLMLIGMALFRYGLFSGGLNARKQQIWGWIGLISGTGLSLGIALWIKASGLTYYGTLAAFVGWSALPRLFMALGLAALLALWGARATGWFAERVSAAGRVAFTNYLGTSVLMLFLVHGWAGGLYGTLSRPMLYLVMLATWALMLRWSYSWLQRFYYGPLEWLWRCLTYGKRFPFKRPAE